MSSAKAPVRDGGTARIDDSRRAGSKDERSTARVVPVEDQLRHRLSCRGRVENTPNTMACCQYAPGAPGMAPISGRPSCVTGRKHAWLDRTRDDASIGEIRAQSAFNLSIAPSSGTTRPGSSREGRVARDRTHIRGAIGTWKHLRREHRARCLRVFEEHRLRWNRRSGIEDKVVSLQPEHGRQRRAIAPRAPTTAPSRSRPHRPRALRRRDRLPRRRRRGATAP